MAETVISVEFFTLSWGVPITPDAMPTGMLSIDGKGVADELVITSTGTGKFLAQAIVDVEEWQTVQGRMFWKIDDIAGSEDFVAQILPAEEEIAAAMLAAAQLTPIHAAPQFNGAPVTAGNPLPTSVQSMAEGAITAGAITDGAAQVITDSLRSGTVTLLSAVSVDGGTLEIIRGDSYEGSDIEWTGDEEDQWPDLTEATIKFGLFYGSTSFQKAASAVTPTGSQKIQLAITSAESAALPVTNVGRWDIQASWPSGRVKTLISGKAIVRPSWTDPGA